MNRVKCSACGFIAFSNEEFCKKCKQNLNDSDVNVGVNTDEKDYSSIYAIVMGILFIAGAFYFYNLFDELERTGGSMRINWFFALLYKIGGKWAVSIFTGLVGILIALTALVGDPDKKEN